jgi:uncharacterized protein (DUF1778 family)
MSVLTNEIKRITIRVPATLHKALAHAAIDRDTSLNRLAVEALEQYLVTLKGKEGRFPLRELGDLLTPAAQAKGLTEEDFMQHVREARQRIWEERYRQMVETLQGRSAG